MRLLVLYSCDEEKEKYEKLLSNISNISCKYFNINTNKYTILFSYIRQAEKIILFLNKENLAILSEKQLEFFEFLTKYNDKVLIITKDVLSQDITKRFSYIYYYNINDKNDYSQLSKQLRKIFNNNDEKIPLIDEKTKKHKKTIKKNILIGAALTIYVLIFSCSLFYGSLYERGIFHNLIMYIIAWILLIIEIIIFLIFMFYKFASLFNRENNKKDNYINKATDLIATGDFLDNSDNKDNNALGRMLLNLDDLQEYYSWSKDQSKTSFYLSIVLIAIGIIIIVGAFLFQIIYKVSITISIVAALGGTIVEFIAGTALVVYKNSLSQLNHYHRVLHEDERFLSSLNIVNNLSNEKDKDEMIKELIRSEIELNKIELSQFLKEK